MATVREKLYDYIRVANDKKLKAIYMMLEDDINEEIEWWKDNAFLNELDKRFAAWEEGKEPGYSLSDIDAAVGQLKKTQPAK